jgi:hypothetical protein
MFVTISAAWPRKTRSRTPPPASVLNSKTGFVFDVQVSAVALPVDLALDLSIFELPLVPVTRWHELTTLALP